MSVPLVDLCLYLLHDEGLSVALVDSCDPCAFESIYTCRNLEPNGAYKQMIDGIETRNLPRGMK